MKESVPVGGWVCVHNEPSPVAGGEAAWAGTGWEISEPPFIKSNKPAGPLP